MHCFTAEALPEPKGRPLALHSHPKQRALFQASKEVSQWVGKYSVVRARSCMGCVVLGPNQPKTLPTFHTNRLTLPGALLEVHRRHLLERQRDHMGGGLARRPRAHHTLAGRAAALHPAFHASTGLTIPTIPRATQQARPLP